MLSLQFDNWSLYEQLACFLSILKPNSKIIANLLPRLLTLVIKKMFKMAVVKLGNKTNTTTVANAKMTHVVWVRVEKHWSELLP